MDRPGRNSERQLPLIHGDITEAIIGCAIAIHRALGPGLLESTYEACLVHELLKRDCRIKQQAELPVLYDGIRLDCGYRIDIIVDEKVLLELKAVERILPIHEAQLNTYLRLSGLRVGLIINFNSIAIRDGIHRLVL